MILNGLGFVSAPLYLYEGFFEGKATAHLLGDHITPQHLNDDCLGRTLDKVGEYGCSALFTLIAMHAYRVFSLSVRRYIQNYPWLLQSASARLETVHC